MKRPEINNFYINEDKYRKSEKHQSHRGAINVGGKLYWIGGWYNDGQYGSYLKGDIREVTEEEELKYFGTESNPAIRNVDKDNDWRKDKIRLKVDEDVDDELPF
jgi:hypothetical protein